jgi:Zn-dependent protease
MRRPTTRRSAYRRSANWVARAFGDETAARLGRLTLNPIRHVDPVGTIGLPLVLAVTGAPVFGWAKPVPVVAARLRHPRWQMMLVALAGPGINLVLALVAAIGLRLMFEASDGATLGDAGRFLFDNLRNFLLINVFLAIFNLIPLPPFDGGHVIEGLLPRSAVPAWQSVARFGFPLLVVLLLVVPMIAPQADIVARAIAPIARAVTLADLGLVGLSF